MASAGDRPYDPYIPSDPAAGAQGGNAAPGNQRTAALQAVSSFSIIPSERDMMERFACNARQERCDGDDDG